MLRASVGKHSDSKFCGKLPSLRRDRLINKINWEFHCVSPWQHWGRYIREAVLLSSGWAIHIGIRPLGCKCTHVLHCMWINVIWSMGMNISVFHPCTVIHSVLLPWMHRMPSRECSHKYSVTSSMRSGWHFTHLFILKVYRLPCISYSLRQSAIMQKHNEQWNNQYSLKQPMSLKSLSEQKCIIMA